MLPPTVPHREKFAISMPQGVKWFGYIYQSPTRDTGRRIIVRDDQGRDLFDTEDCYDLGNATNKLDTWLSAEVRRITDKTRPCDLCGQPVGPDDDGQRTEVTTVCGPCLLKAVPAK